MSAKRHKRPGFKDEAIDINELANMSNMKGMLSFLDTKPEDYARLFAVDREGTSLPQTVDDEDHCTALPESNLLSGSSLRPGSSLTANGRLPPGSSLQPGNNLPAGDLLQSSDLVSSPARAETEQHEHHRSVPGSDLPTAILSEEKTLRRPPPGSNRLPGSKLLKGIRQSFKPSEAGPRGSILLSSSELITEQGRTVRIREARSVQDAHTNGEHLLLTLMWKRGVTETDKTKLIKAGLAELARLSGCHKTSCRQYLRALMAKLAVEEAQTFEAAAGKEGARVYRIFSFQEILDRRKMAGLTHVIRTGAVSFVDPQTGTRLSPDRRLQSGSNLRAAGKFLPDSTLEPDADSNHASTPGRNQHSLSINNVFQKDLRTTTSQLAARLAEDFPYFVDGAAAARILKSCLEIIPDATLEEIALLFGARLPLLLKNRRIDNPVGLMISSVPDWFNVKRVSEIRGKTEQGRKEAYTSAEDLAHYEQLLELMPSHPQAEDWRQLAENIRAEQK